jgi:WD40 repeat protein
MIDLKKLVKQENNSSLSIKNLQVKKAVLPTTCPIFSLKYSNLYPHLLAASEEQGYITLIDTNIHKQSQQNNNTIPCTQISPTMRSHVHDNIIFDIDWCCSDTRIITASGEANSILFNIETEAKEAVFYKGHSASVKCVKQAFFNEHIFATCGRDGLILLWDSRQGIVTTSPGETTDCCICVSLLFI